MCVSVCLCVNFKELSIENLFQISWTEVEAVEIKMKTLVIQGLKRWQVVFKRLNEANDKLNQG